MHLKKSKKLQKGAITLAAKQVKCDGIIMAVIYIYEKCFYLCKCF